MKENHPKLNWQTEIAKFDEDLRIRMREINFREFCFPDLTHVEQNFVRKMLGYVNHGYYPWWRGKEWQYRNSDRVNSYHRRYNKSPKMKVAKHEYYLKYKERNERKEYYIAYRKTHKEYAKQYALSHKEHSKEYYRKRYARMKEAGTLPKPGPARLLWQHEYYLRNKEKRKEYYKVRNSNPEVLARAKQWRIDNWDRILALKRERYAKKKESK
jgi:hypothetical protein